MKLGLFHFVPLFGCIVWPDERQRQIQDLHSLYGDGNVYGSPGTTRHLHSIILVFLWLLGS